MIVRPADPDHPAVAAVIAAHVAHSDANYPMESCHHLRPEEYAGSGIALFGAWDGEACLGTIGLKRLSGEAGEIKSMHVLAAARGRGVGAGLILHLLQEATDRGYRRLFLETGSQDPSAAARRLYERIGFVFCPPFPPYRADPASVFMTLDLETRPRP